VFIPITRDLDGKPNRRVYISSNETRIATTATDKTAHIWRLANLVPLDKTMKDCKMITMYFKGNRDDYELQMLLSISNITDEITETKKQKTNFYKSKMQYLLYLPKHKKILFAFEAKHGLSGKTPFS